MDIGFAEPLARAVILGSVRTSVAMTFLPPPFGGVAPTPARVLLAVAISFISNASHAVLDMDSGRGPWTPLDFVADCAAEFMAGAVIGLTSRLVLASAEVAGGAISTSMGFGFASQIDPTNGEESTAVAQLLWLVAICIWFSLNGHHQVIAACAIPTGQTLEYATANTEALVRHAHTFVQRGITLALPVVGAMLFVHIGSATLARMVQRVQLFGVVFGIAAIVGIANLELSAGALVSAIADQLRTSPLTEIDPRPIHAPIQGGVQ